MKIINIYFLVLSMLIGHGAFAANLFGGAIKGEQAQKECAGVACFKNPNEWYLYSCSEDSKIIYIRKCQQLFPPKSISDCSSQETNEMDMEKFEQYVSFQLLLGKDYGLTEAEVEAGWKPKIDEKTARASCEDARVKIAQIESTLKYLKETGFYKNEHAEIYTSLEKELNSEKMKLSAGQENLAVCLNQKSRVQKLVAAANEATKGAINLINQHICQSDFKLVEVNTPLYRALYESDPAKVPCGGATLDEGIKDCRGYKDQRRAKVAARVINPKKDNEIDEFLYDPITSLIMGPEIPSAEVKEFFENIPDDFIFEMKYGKHCGKYFVYEGKKYNDYFCAAQALCEEKAEEEPYRFLAKNWNIPTNVEWGRLFNLEGGATGSYPNLNIKKVSSEMAKGWYWTSTPVDNAKAWQFDGYFGNLNYSDRDGSYNIVRCIGSQLRRH